MRLIGRGLRYRYPGEDRTVLDDVDVTVEAGRTTAVIGPSGSGKTTLLAVLGQLLTPLSGEVALEGVPGGAAPGARTSWIFQTVNVLPERTALENVAIGAYGRGLRGDEARAVGTRCLAQVGLERRAGTRARLLSGGEVQRVVIARALASDRPVILADEPTGQLDQRTTGVVLNVLVGGSAHRCVVVVTHDPEVAGRCHRVLRLADGRLHEEDPRRVGTVPG